jgi:hypothetical protein
VIRRGGRKDLVAAAVPAATADCLVGVGGGIAMHDIEALLSSKH